MAATFNSPLRAVMLAVELLLFEWRPRSYVPVAAAVVRGGDRPPSAARRRRPFPGRRHAAPRPTATYGCASSRAIAPALLALLATVLVYAAEDAFRRLPIHWMWWPAIGGLIIGLGGLIVPQALGVGYNVIGAELNGTIGLDLVVGILIVKTLIWSLSLGSGTSGGVLAPMFMIGGALGALEAHLFPSVGARLLGAGRTGWRARRRDALTAHRRRLRPRAHPPLRRRAATDDWRLDRLRGLGAAAQTLGTHREDRPPRLPPRPASTASTRWRSCSSAT